MKNKTKRKIRCGLAFTMITACVVFFVLCNTLTIRQIWYEGGMSFLNSEYCAGEQELVINDTVQVYSLIGVGNKGEKDNYDCTLFRGRLLNGKKINEKESMLYDCSSMPYIHLSHFNNQKINDKCKLQFLIR